MKMIVVVFFAAVLLMSSSQGESVFDRLGSALDNAIDSAKESVGDSFAGQFVLGAVDMKRAYDDMREANWKESDKYFHARGNHDAAKRGPGGELAAEVISNVREMTQLHHREDSEADQEANRWGREGGDPNKYRPQGLPDKY